jgi:hypothetical protein
MDELCLLFSGALNPAADIVMARQEVHHSDFALGECFIVFSGSHPCQPISLARQAAQDEGLALDHVVIALSRF